MVLAESFRKRVLARKPLVGTFIKTPTGHAIEILGAAGFDFVVIDQEHGPFDRSSTDVALLAARAMNIPALVRVAGSETVLSVLDCGATGILMPHVSSVEKAQETAALCRYRGRRGFATSNRAGNYTATPMWQHIDQADADTVVIAQIEDPVALSCVDDIANVDGIDSLFLGRGDLTAAYNDRSTDPKVVRDACARIADAATNAGRTLSAFAGGAGESGYLSKLGVSMFILSSDQSFLRSAAFDALSNFKKALEVQ